MTQDLLKKINAERFLPSEYADELLFMEEFGVPCRFVVDGPSEALDECLEPYAADLEVYRDPRLSADAKSLFTVVNSFRSYGEPLPKVGWLICNMRFSPDEFFAARAQLIESGLIGEGDLA